MPRIEPIEMEAATGKARDLLQEPAGRGGEPGSMVRVMANAPALAAHTAAARELGLGELDIGLAREGTAPTGCGRCATAA